MEETSDLEIDDPEKASYARRKSKTICYDSESSVKTKLETCKCNNNIGDCDIGLKNDEFKVICACLKENRQNDGNISAEFQRQLCPKKKKSFSKKSKRKSNVGEISEDCKRFEGENKCCKTSSEHNSRAVGGDGEEKTRERLQCRQHELNPSSNEINSTDVTMSCDLTSISVINFKAESCEDENNENKTVQRDCPSNRNNCSVFQSTCSEGSYSRRKHHKHHKHKKRSSSPVVEPESNAPITPKVNPIFLWVRQEDTKIVEVLCEDYDHRNRLRLTRTHLGWRAIPKTKRFAEAIIPRAVPNEEEKGLCDSLKPKHAKKVKRRKKAKRKKESKLLDNPNLIKECSVALCRGDLANYKCKALISNSMENEVSDEDIDASSKPESYFSKSENTKNQSRPSSPDSIKSLSNIRRLIKSNSCDFPSLQKSLKTFPRSISLDLKLQNNTEFKVQKRLEEARSTEEIVSGMKSEQEERKEILEKPTQNAEKDSEFQKKENQRNHSESMVLDMTKHDLDFNDTDCDELGQLLKDIPDLEFVEEELEEINEGQEEDDDEDEEEEEEWLKPTDLSVQKNPTTESEMPGIKLPATITPVVTVTSSVKPPEPLAAPLPEVTITPILKPKPAHQQKPQNNFLESLLCSSSIKPESHDVNISQKKQGKPMKFAQCEKKTLKHFQEADFDSEIKNKKLKVEDITLKNLLSKQNLKSTQILASEGTNKLKSLEGEECTNSRLQELLTDTASSDPITQLKEVLSNPLLSVPDPLLVPRARLPALVASPASEIPRLLSMHLEKTFEETPSPPVTDSDILEVSLSNLQSLLSCTPDKLKTANTQDLAKYQKSLETFLEWQRYQNRLMESQLKNSKSVLNGFPADISDVAAATAFSQMLWLPYLNQLDFNCSANRDFMSLTNPVLLNDYQANCSNLNAPPQINTSHVSQPSPFLTPTSPMEFESHLKTLAMWQEALMMQQNSQFSRVCSKVSSGSSNHQDGRRSSKFSNHPTNIKKSNPESNLQSPRMSAISPISSRVDHPQNSHLDFDFYQNNHAAQNDYYKKQSRSLHQEYQQKSKAENQFRKMNNQSEFLKQCKVGDKNRKSGCVSVKPMANLMDKTNSKSCWEQEDFKKSADFTSQVASKLQQFNTQIQKTTRKEEKTTIEDSNLVDVKPCVSETPKLKVKNLVDPNKSPPKLLKRIAPEHLPILMNKGSVQDDGQTNLWHPLFGSNQIKLPPYHSPPWRWTTVTVNGE